MILHCLGGEDPYNFLIDKGSITHHPSSIIQGLFLRVMLWFANVGPPRLPELLLRRQKDISAVRPL